MTPERAPRSAARSDDAAATAAAVSAFALLANQVAGRSVRDALFLSQFDVSALPRTYAASAFVALVAVALAARPAGRLGPQRMLTGTLVGSSALLLLVWLLASVAPRTAAIALYLQLAITGSVLASWFWGMISDRFDPRAARRRIASISAAATLGGLAGGVLAVRAAAIAPITALLPLLALLHAAGAFFSARVGSGAPASGEDDGGPAGVSAVLDAMRAPVVRDLALLVAATAAGATLVDFVFKARAQTAYPDGADMRRYCAIYYTAASLLTFLVQTFFARRLLQRAGLAPTASTLPAATAAFGLGALGFPGLAATALLRGVEASLRASLFRSSYELFYTPMERRVRRAAKPLVDVGFDRVGEGTGAVVVHLALAAGLAAPEPLLIGLALALALLCLALAPRLHRGYIAALEARLTDPAAPLDPDSIEDETTRSTVMRSLAAISTASVSADAVPAVPAKFATVTPGRASRARHGAPDAPAPAEPTRRDAIPEHLAALRSADSLRVRAILAAPEPLDPALVPQAIRLLAWDAVAADAARALARVATPCTGQLTDALLNPDESFAIRRRVPRLLARSDSPRAAAALLEGLNDARFEVRYRCAESLAKLRARRGEDAVIDAGAVLDVVVRETSGDRLARAAGALLDPDEDDSPVPSVALRYIGRLLALAYSRSQVDAAFDCLERGDARLRGPALEYLETMLPAGVRESVVRSIEGAVASRAAAALPAEPDAGALERSHETVRLNLERIRRGGEGSGR